MIDGLGVHGANHRDVVGDTFHVRHQLAHLDARGAAALNALDHAGDRAKPHAAAIAALPRKSKVTPPRMGNYLLRLIEKITADLGHKTKPTKRP